jgi:hypothetical protein
VGNSFDQSFFHTPIDLSQSSLSGTNVGRGRLLSGPTAFKQGILGIELTRLRHITLLAMAVLLVGFAAPAMAQDSSVDDGYGNQSTTNKLPFSGLDLGLIAAGGALFVLAGVGLRRAVRTD